MADLSQNQPTPLQTPDAPVSDQPPVEEPKPAQTSDIPTSDQPPVAQPDKSSFPPMQDGEKPISPKQEEIKKELSELGIPPEGRTKKTRVLLAALGVFLLIVSLPAAVYLVKQRQEIRKEAYPGQVCTTNADCSGDECCGFGTGTCRSECHISGDSYICCNGDWVPQAQGCGDCVTPTQETNCTDGIDNDNDGNTDCADSDCSSNPACQGQVSCSAGPGGVSATNNSNQQVCGDYFKGKCPGDYSCFCGGSPTSFCLGPGESMSRGLDISGLCGSWQADITIGDCHASDAGCEYCEVEEAHCDYCKIFDADWNEITDLPTLTVGQIIYLATRGSTTHPQGIDKARFRINSGDWQETTAQHGVEFYIQYTIPSAGSYTIESMVHNPTLGWY